MNVISINNNNILSIVLHVVLSISVVAFVVGIIVE